MEPPRKRIRLGPDSDTPDASTIRARRAGLLASLSNRVSPPPTKCDTATNAVPVTKSRSSDISTAQQDPTSKSLNVIDLTANEPESPTHSIRVLPSPVQLTRIRDLPASDNVDTISLKDILGDPLIKEAWIFNFCFDVEWTMQHFDPDVRELVKVKIIHGSWRREDLNKIYIDEACARWPNIESIQAYLPDPFGTHHSKMFILFRHDEQAQVIIHTANMLAKDWTNMTQAIWRSPLLPRNSRSFDSTGHPDSGSLFKHDLKRYLTAYGNKLKGLVKELDSHNFVEVKAALIASVPSDFAVSAPDDVVWGHEALRRTLKIVPVSKTSHFIYQVSSIASLPAKWLTETLYSATGGTSRSTSIIYPTSEDVRLSLDGYASGGSIHTKAQTPTHLKQISALHSQLCRWTSGSNTSTQAGRSLAAPHIKTYIRFAAKPDNLNPSPNIDWALVTSANLSTQAWGSATKLPKEIKDAKEARIKIQSFEIGVLVWPALYAKHDEEMSQVKMVPTLKRDMPRNEEGVVHGTGVRIGFRMPYDLPLTSYETDEMPWSPHSTYGIPDGSGATWPPSFR